MFLIGYLEQLKEGRYRLKYIECTATELEQNRQIKKAVESGKWTESIIRRVDPCIKCLIKAKEKK